MNEILRLTEAEFTALLRSAPRVKSPAQVAAEVAARDEELGPYVPHYQHIHYEGAVH